MQIFSYKSLKYIHKNTSLFNPTLTLQRKISLFSMFFVSETADNQFRVCREAICSTQACRKKCVPLRHVFRFGQKN